MSDNDREILVDEKQREAERSALKRVRGVLDGIDKEERDARRLRRVVFVVAVALLVLLVVYFTPVLMKSKDSGTPPAWPRLQQKQ